MKCTIIASGDFKPDRKMIDQIRSSKHVVCADGGARHLKALDILPDVIIGDFDSILPEDRRYFEEKRVKLVEYPRQKNHTDSELCINWALEKKVTDVTVLGGIGTRMDHSLANIFMLKTLAENQIGAHILTARSSMHAIFDQIVLDGVPGNLLSLVPLTETVTGITLKGLAYPLTNASITMGSSLGVSNVFDTNQAVVSIQTGILLVIQPME